MPRNHKSRRTRHTPQMATSAARTTSPPSRHLSARRKALVCLTAGLAQLVSLAALHGTTQVVAIVVLATLNPLVVHQVKNRT